MSRVIKHDLAALTVDRLPHGGAREMVVACDPRDARIVVLEQMLVEERDAAERALAAQIAEAKQAVVDARRAGRAEAVTDEAKRMALIAAGVEQAVAAWRERLEATERLAAQMATLVLERMFGEDADLAGFVTRALAQYVSRIGAHAVVGVTVSSLDFQDVTDLGAMVAVSDDLPRGACRVALRLGQVEVDPLGQWAAYEAALRAMGAGA